LIAGFLVLGPAAAPAQCLTGEPIGTTFQVELGGQAIPTIRYEDIDYVHFPFTGAVDVGITRSDGQVIR